MCQGGRMTAFLGALGARTLKWLLSLGHAAYFFVSPFDRAAIVTVDGYGERPAALIAAGSVARTCVGSPSVRPICSPSAPTSTASTGSSSTKNGNPTDCTRRAKAPACWRRSAPSAVLLRYWIAPTPPRIAADTALTRRAVSAQSGVIR